MALAASEISEDTYRALDGWSPECIAAAVLDGQAAALETVRPVLPNIARAAKAVAERLAGGGRVVYVGAGSSGLIALTDALELPGTFGLDDASVRVVLAGGVDSLSGLIASAEDDEGAGRGAIMALELGPSDCVIAVAASGETPFTCAAIEEAKSRGIWCLGIANTPATRLLRAADIAVCLQTPPEVIAGSTRLGAGTAQKCALNALSTLIGVELGHVYEGLMVNLKAENEKLRRRAERIVAIAGRSDEVKAAEMLAASGGDVKAAIAALRLGIPVDEAQTRLNGHGGNLRRLLGG